MSKAFNVVVNLSIVVGAVVSLIYIAIIINDYSASNKRSLTYKELCAPKRVVRIFDWKHHTYVLCASRNDSDWTIIESGD